MQSCPSEVMEAGGGSWQGGTRLHWASQHIEMTHSLHENEDANLIIDFFPPNPLEWKDWRLKCRNLRLEEGHL